MTERYDTTRARAIGLLGAGLLRALGSTWRPRVVGAQHLAACRAAGRGFIYALWHGDLFPLVYLTRGQGITTLVSLNKDGEYITQLLHRLDFATVRGSTSRGGLRSLLEMVRLGGEGRELAFTPDGPRGPRHRVQPGVLLCSQRAAIPILPLAAAVRPAKQLASWDRFVIPAPFARIVMGFGPPLHVPRAVPVEELGTTWARRLEAALASLNATCVARLAGATSEEPA